MKTYTAYVQQDGDELILPLPDQLCNELGWKMGDVLVWDIDEQTGAVTLRKKPSWYHILWSKVRSWIK